MPRLAGLDLQTATATDPLVGLSPFSLVLPVQPADSLANGPAGEIDLLIGTNTEEGHLYLVPQGNLDGLTDASAILGEALFGSGTARMIEAHTRLSGGRTHVYRFGYRSTAMGGKLGAAHTVELPFVFDIADEPWLHGPAGLLGPDEASAGLATRMHDSWVAFARTGDPGWAAYDGETRTLEYFG
jgi:para-nitrobenzyl esterase